MTTALDIVTKALQKIGAIVKNEAPSSDEADDGFYALGALIDSWSNESLMVYTNKWETLTLTPGDGAYSIGSAADLNTKRPMHIILANIKIGDTEYPVSIVPDHIFNGAITNKTLQGIPQFLTYDNNYVYGGLKLWPIPDSAYQLNLLSEKAYDPMVTTADVLYFPPGWERALIYNLAVELAPEYSQQVDPAVYAIAKESKAAIKMQVARNKTMDASPVIYARATLGRNGGIW